VLVIDDGRCAFFGPTDRAKGYFEELGFECPPRQTTADFLTAVTDPNARVIKDVDKVPRTAEDLERCFRNSPDAKANFDAIDKFEVEIQQNHSGDAFRDAVQGGKAKNTSNRSVYTISFYQQVRACTIRQYQVLWGDKTTFIGKNFLTMFQALIIGSLFYNQPTTSAGVFTRGGVMLYLRILKLSNSIKLLPPLQRPRCSQRVIRRIRLPSHPPET
jgi:ATP-binding cassette subfamily G (WHITE) protein 2 (SNQ2)